MAESPARRIGWMSRHGHRLQHPDEQGVMICPESGFRYKEIAHGVVRCLDLDEDALLPEHLRAGTVGYRELQKRARRETVVAA
jgi:UDP-2-acetamido-3-amino-2,3-dideoxy-glucuronate N-acetyltransferase